MFMYLLLCVLLEDYKHIKELVLKYRAYEYLKMLGLYQNFDSMLSKPTFYDKQCVLYKIIKTPQQQSKKPKPNHCHSWVLLSELSNRSLERYRSAIETTERMDWSQPIELRQPN